MLVGTHTEAKRLQHSTSVAETYKGTNKCNHKLSSSHNHPPSCWYSWLRMLSSNRVVFFLLCYMIKYNNRRLSALRVIADFYKVISIYSCLYLVRIFRGMLYFTTTVVCVHEILLQLSQHAKLFSNKLSGFRFPILKFRRFSLSYVIKPAVRNDNWKNKGKASPWALGNCYGTFFPFSYIL